MCNVIIAFKLKQNSHTWIRVINFPTQQEQAKIEFGMDGFTSKKEPWEWAWTIDTLSLLIFITFISPPLKCAHVFNKIPTDPYGNYNYSCHLWFSTPLVSLSLSLSFYSKMVSLVRQNSMLIWSQQLSIVKSLHHRLTSFMLNPPDLPGFPPSR